MAAALLGGSHFVYCVGVPAGPAPSWVSFVGVSGLSPFWAAAILYLKCTIWYFERVF